MKVLIDTHAFIWYATGDSRLSTKAINIIESDNERYISIVSLWGMAIKVNLGKLSFSESFEKILNTQIEINDYKILPIHPSHLVKLTNLELLHRDPFDRLLICQATVENMPLLSTDRAFNLYQNIKLIW